MNIPSSWITGFLVIWAVLFGYALISRLLRLRGKPGGLVEPRPDEVLFDESYASARSHKSTFTRLGGGTRCMRVSVTKRALFVRPHFPFSLIGVDADLVHEIPHDTISDVAEFSESGVSAIAVRFGGERRVDLVLKRQKEFLSSMLNCLGSAKSA